MYSRYEARTFLTVVVIMNERSSNLDHIPRWGGMAFDGPNGATEPS